MIIKGLILIFVFASTTMFITGLLPIIFKYYRRMQEHKVEVVSRKLDNLFMDVQRKRLTSLFVLTPIVLAGLGILLTRNLIIGIFLGLLGLGLPNVLVKVMERKRLNKFEGQLVESLVVLSSCLKAGLSLLQSFEVLVEDMPPPLSQEIAWMIKEIKMGVALDESLKRLSQRVHSSGLALIVSSIAVAQVSGGDLVKVFNRLITTLRNSRKLQESIATLTLQGRMQGMILSVLPFLFIWWVFAFNRQYFDIMFSSETGRFLLILAVILQVVGMFLIRKFSRIKI